MTSTSTTTTDAYQVAFIDIAIGIVNVVISTLLLIMQQVLTGVFSFFMPAS